MTVKLLPCPFCFDPMEDRGYGALHVDGRGCPIGDLAIDVERWNRRAPSPSPETGGGEQAPKYPTYIITQEPREVPRRKGPFYGNKMVEDFLREAYRYNPDIICIVIDMETEDNTWYPEHGYEWLDINGDRRKRHPRKDRPHAIQPPVSDVAGVSDLIKRIAETPIWQDTYPDGPDVMDGDYRITPADVRACRAVATEADHG